jgi:hypothetical protein
MRPEDLSDARLDEMLRRQPRWEPPRHFARAVIARLPVAIPATPPPAWGGLVVFRAAAVGALAASVALTAGLLVSWAMLEVVPGVIILATAPEMFLEFATFALIEHATSIAWITAALTLSLAASVTGRLQEWI